MYKIVFLCMLTFSFVSCTQKVIKLREVLVEEIPEAEKIPPVCGMISEIVHTGGVPTVIYAKIGNKNKFVKEKLKGYIYNDPGKKEKIGKFEINKLFANFAECKVLELSYELGKKATLCVEVDPRFPVE